MGYSPEMFCIQFCLWLLSFLAFSIQFSFSLIRIQFLCATPFHFFPCMTFLELRTKRNSPVDKGANATITHCHSNNTAGFFYLQEKPAVTCFFVYTCLIFLMNYLKYSQIWKYIKITGSILMSDPMRTAIVAETTVALSLIFHFSITYCQSNIQYN